MKLWIYKHSHNSKFIYFSFFQFTNVVFIYFLIYNFDIRVVRMNLKNRLLLGLWELLFLGIDEFFKKNLNAQIGSLRPLFFKLS